MVEGPQLESWGMEAFATVTTTSGGWTVNDCCKISGFKT